MERGVELIAPVMGGASPLGEITLADFTLAENDVVLTCPAGHAPSQMKRKANRLGLKAVRFSVFLKATGLNILRAATFRAKIDKTTENKQIY